MTAYVIVDINVTDPVRYEDYKKLAAPTVEMYGGKYIARGGKTEVLEGDWQPSRPPWRCCFRSSCSRWWECRLLPASWASSTSSPP